MLAADPWFALDKLEHFLFCAVVVGASYAGLFRLGCNRTVSLSVAVLLSIVAAGGKELGDYLQVCHSCKIPRTSVYVCAQDSEDCCRCNVAQYSRISATCQLASHCVLICPILFFPCCLLLLPAESRTTSTVVARQPVFQRLHS
jgi:hypothetical protein